MKLCWSRMLNLVFVFMWNLVFWLIDFCKYCLVIFVVVCLVVMCVVWVRLFLVVVVFIDLFCVVFCVSFINVFWVIVVRKLLWCLLVRLDVLLVLMEILLFSDIICLFGNCVLVQVINRWCWLGVVFELYVLIREVFCGIIIVFIDRLLKMLCVIFVCIRSGSLEWMFVVRCVGIEVFVVSVWVLIYLLVLFG